MQQSGRMRHLGASIGWCSRLFIRMRWQACIRYVPGFRFYVDVIEIGGWGTIEQIHATKPLFDGCVASISDLLLLLRAVTVVNRGGEGDIWDFKWLLLKVVKQDCFPDIGDEELEDLCSAVELCLGKMGRLVVAAIIGSSNSNAAMMLLA